MSNVQTEDPDDKLSKARFLMEFKRKKNLKLFQPFQNICTDECMVRNKGRYSFRQYICDKPTKWGMKLWVLADSSTGYTCDFDVCLGKNTVLALVSVWLMMLLRILWSLLWTKVIIYFLIIFTQVCSCSGIWLAKALEHVVLLYFLSNRKGFPAQLKNVKESEKKSNRGDIRWDREGDILSMPWGDKKVVSFLPSKRNRKSRKQMYRLWDLPAFPEWQKLSAQFSWVLVYFTVSVMCVRMLRSIFTGSHAWTLWNLWFQGLWKHVSVITNVISVAYCLVVLSISLITAFIGDVFMCFGETDFGKLPFLEYKIYKYWLTYSMKHGLFDGAMVLVQ